MPPPSVFLSHTSVDKPFARRLATDLKLAGAHVWLDEAEIRLGESLIEVIGAAIHDVEYVAVILSPEAVESKWVKKELEIAIGREFTSEQVVVLPLLYRSCQIPAFLTGKLYADFRGEDKYANALNLIKQRLSLPLSVSAVPDLEGIAADIQDRVQAVLLGAEQALRHAESAHSEGDAAMLSRLLREATSIVAHGRISNGQIAMLRAFQSGHYSARQTSSVDFPSWIRRIFYVVSGASFHRHDLDLNAQPPSFHLAIDTALLEAALFNLFDNAIKYSYADEPIYVRVRRASKATTVDITSKGPPVETNQTRRIFEAGYRSARAVHAHTEGAGSGLYISRLIAEAHGGTLKFRRGADENLTTVVLEIPAIWHETAA